MKVEKYSLLLCARSQNGWYIGENADGFHRGEILFTVSHIAVHGTKKLWWISSFSPVSNTFITHYGQFVCKMRRSSDRYFLRYCYEQIAVCVANTRTQRILVLRVYYSWISEPRDSNLSFLECFIILNNIMQLITLRYVYKDIEFHF